MPIDTLKASKRLKDLGFDTDQAEGLAELLSDLDVASATKEDLDDAEDRLLQRINQVDAHIDEVEKGLTQHIDEVENSLNQRIDKVEDGLNQRIDKVEDGLNQRIDEVDKSLNQRIDEVEKSLNERIGEVEKDLSGDIEDAKGSLTKNMNHRTETLEAEVKKYVMSRVGWAVGLLAVWIALLNYLMG